MKKDNNIKRRDFVEFTGLSAFALGLSPNIASAAKGIRTGEIISSNEKLRIAIVGCGGRGKHHVIAAKKESIVALCDVDAGVAYDSFNNHRRVKKYQDYRKMLKEMDKKIDAVMIAVPDHMHFPVAKAAIKMGKHVLVEKPLTHTIAEARELLLLARKHKVITQMGNHGHANVGTRMVREWIQQGAIGKVREVHLWTNRPVWPQGIKRPKKSQAVPDTTYINRKKKAEKHPLPYNWSPDFKFDWDLWLGVAPRRPYNECYVPFKWRGWWDFGCGALGDMGCHIMDSTFWALDLKYPVSVKAKTSSVNNETAPEWSIVTYQFPARGSMPPVKVVWHDGGKVPPRPKHLERRRAFVTGKKIDKEKKGVNRNGGVLIGEKASILTDTYSKSVRIIPESKMKRPERTIRRIRGADHFREWFDACKGGPLPGSNFEYSAPLTEMVLLGNFAVRTGKKIEWNGEKMECTNLPELNKYVRKDYRKF